MRTGHKGRKSTTGLCAVVFITFTFGLAAWAQDYSIDWHTIDGGGGTSTGGVYSITGTVGQPDAGEMSGGTYVVQGGFWSWVVEIENVGKPTLRIARNLTSGAMIVSWSQPATGWVLQETDSLGQPGQQWQIVPGPYNEGPSDVTVTLSPSTGNRFYRLSREQQP